ncbi:MAG: peptidoglycan bridge formation glycyltransferase FemA/FemB family protein [Armatimonadetes bacterium]|nr:peptidoglycan bridge formation glycyltransferase FemA/FemB family protein [Armatimonadota bacterium]
MQVREIPESERTRWNDFVAAQKTGDLLQSFEWGDLKASGGWRPIRLAAEDDGRIVGAVSVLERRLHRLVNKCIFYAPRGPVCDFSGSTDVLSALLDGVRERASREGAILLKIDPPIRIEDEAPPFEQLGFKRIADEDGFGGVQPRCVMQLDLRPTLDEILAGFKPKWRYNIRLAEKKDVTVRSSCTRDDLKAFYKVLRETAVRDRFLVRGFEYYDQMWTHLVEPGYAKLFLTEYEGRVIAGALSFVFGDKCWYTYGASSNEHRNVMPNHLMQWRMIEWAKQSGCAVYDFRGVSQKQDSDAEDDHLQGLNRFKAGFGAQFVEYVGEFDLPYSTPWYWLWVTAKPRVSVLMKSLNRRGGGRHAPGGTDL